MSRKHKEWDKGKDTFIEELPADEPAAETTGMELADFGFQAPKEKNVRGVAAIEQSAFSGSSRNVAVLNYTIAITKLGHSADISDPEDMWAHFMKYLEICAQYGVRVGNQGAYTSMGISKQLAAQWHLGQKKASDPRFKNLIDDVKRVCASYREAAMAEKDGLNPLIGIWWQKNYDGMSNEPVPEIPEANPLNEIGDVQAIKEKYSDLPDD